MRTSVERVRGIRRETGAVAIAGSFIPLVACWAGVLAGRRAPPCSRGWETEGLRFRRRYRQCVVFPNRDSVASKPRRLGPRLQEVIPERSQKADTACVLACWVAGSIE